MSKIKSMNNKNSFLAEIELRNAFGMEFMSLIPAQRKHIDELMNQGKVVNYALAIDRAKLWVTFEAKNEEEVMDILATFPLIKFMKPDITELAFLDSIHSGFPHLSLN